MRLFPVSIHFSSCAPCLTEIPTIKYQLACIGTLIELIGSVHA